MFRPLDVTDWAAFENWMNTQEGRRATHLINMDELIDAATSVSGMRWVCWRSLQEHHKGVRIEQVGKLMSLALMSEFINQLMALPEPESSDPPKLKEVSP